MAKQQPLVSAHTDINIQFYDVDPMRIVWHGNYVKYLEEARCVLLDKLGYNYDIMEQSGYMWPIVDMRLKYVASARFGSKIRVDAHLVEYESRIKINYVITDLGTGQVLTKAFTVQVALDKATQELQFESPKIFIDKVKPFLEQTLF